MLTLKIKDIFSNRAEQTYGLMYKDEYEKDCCALFSFKEHKVLSFHTANCKFPILVVYLRDDLSIDSWYLMYPNESGFKSIRPCKFAVEMEFDKHKLIELKQAVMARFDLKDKTISFY